MACHSSSANKTDKNNTQSTSCKCYLHSWHCYSLWHMIKQQVFNLATVTASTESKISTDFRGILQWEIDEKCFSFEFNNLFNSPIKMNNIMSYRQNAWSSLNISLQMFLPWSWWWRWWPEEETFPLDCGRLEQIWVANYHTLVQRLQLIWPIKLEEIMHWSYVRKIK